MSHCMAGFIQPIFNEGTSWLQTTNQSQNWVTGPFPGRREHTWKHHNVTTSHIPVNGTKPSNTLWVFNVVAMKNDSFIRRAGWGFSLICGLSQDKWPSKMGTYHWEGHQVFLMHICRVQSQVPFSGVCAHLRDLAKNGTGTYHWEVTGICVQTSDKWAISHGYVSHNQMVDV